MSRPRRSRKRHTAARPRLRPVPAGRVNDEPGGLVDDEQVLVLPGDAKVHLLGLWPPTLGRQLGNDRLAALEPVALGTVLPVDEHRPGPEEPLRLRARADLGPFRERTVEARAPRRVRDAKAESRQAEGAAVAGRPRRAPRRESRRRRR